MAQEFFRINNLQDEGGDCVRFVLKAACTMAIVHGAGIIAVGVFHPELTGVGTHLMGPFLLGVGACLRWKLA